MTVKQLLLWLPMIAIAFLNAALRELVLAKHLDPLQAHQASTITLIIACAAYIHAITGALAFADARQAWLTGAVWVLLTMVFEFSLGRLTHKPWQVLFADYDITAGRIWPVFLTCLLILPYICWKLRR